MYSEYLSYERTNPIRYEGTVKPRTDNTQIHLKELTSIARTLAIGLNRERKETFRENNHVFKKTLSDFGTPVSSEYFKQIKTQSERRWQQFFKQNKSFEELDINTERKFGRTLRLSKDMFEIQASGTSNSYILKTTDLTPKLELTISGIDINLQNHEIQAVRLVDIHTETPDIVITIKPSNNLKTSIERELTPGTIKKYFSEDTEADLFKPLFERYLNPVQYRDIVLFMKTDREIATVPIINSNIFPLVKAVCDIYDGELIILPERQTFILAQTNKKVRKAKQLKSEVEKNVLTENEFHKKFGTLLGYPQEVITNYKTLSELGYNPKTAYLEICQRLIDTGQLDSGDMVGLGIIPYVPSSNRESIKTASNEGKTFLKQLKETELGREAIKVASQ